MSTHKKIQYTVVQVDGEKYIYISSALLLMLLSKRLEGVDMQLLHIGNKNPEDVIDEILKTLHRVK